MKMMRLGVTGLTVTLSLVSSASTRVIDAFRTSEVREEIALSDGDELVVAGTNADVVIRGRVTGPNATLCGRLGRPGSCGNKAVFHAPIDVKAIRWGVDYGEGGMELFATGSSWRRFELSYARVTCKAPNVLSPSGALTWGSYYRGDMDRNATFDLGGFDQTIDRLDSTSSPKGKNSDHVYSQGGTLTMRGTADAVCLARIDGGLSLVWDPIGDYTQAFDERDNGTIGTIEVRRGTLRIGPDGSFRNVREIKVGTGASVVCESRKPGALSSVAIVELAKDASLKITGANPFVPGRTKVVCGRGATVKSEVPLFLKGQETADETPPQAIADKLQVFWDDQIVDASRTTATRVPHQPEFAGKVFRFDKPWEGDAGPFGSVVRADGKWLMYRQIFRLNETSPHYHGMNFTLLESRDGITWSRRNVNRYVVCGEKENNVVTEPGVNFWDNFMVFKDTNPACPKDERFKGVTLYDKKWSEEFEKSHPEFASLAKGGKALVCLVSADGITFKPGWKIMDYGYMGLRFDTLNVGFWDPARKEYHLYMRSIRASTYERYSGASSVRWVKHAVSKDFRTWSKPEDIEFADGFEDCELYTNNMEAYPRNPELIIGFPTRYTDRKRWMPNYDRLCGMAKRRERMGIDPRHGLAITDVIFTWSRDGKRFMREEDAFITPGPEEPRGWLYASGYPVRGVVITPGRWGDDPELSFYTMVGDWGTGPCAEMNRYALRMDGFVSYHGRRRTEKLVTKRLVFTGDEMLVNFKTSGGGRMFVTIRDEAGKMAGSGELFGDKVDRIVDFDVDSLAAFAGRPVTVSFELSDADVYSFRFRKRATTHTRPIDAASLAKVASAYDRTLREAGVSNLTDRVRVAYLGALNMRYRVTGEKSDLEAAQGLFALLCDAKRPKASDFANDAEQEDRWLAVADAHFKIAKDPWPVRAVCGGGRNGTPLSLCYRVKYLNQQDAHERLKSLGEKRKDLPRDEERFADRMAVSAVGASSPADVARVLKGLRPSSQLACAEWLWAYWTARQVED